MARLKKVAINNKSVSEIKSDLLVSGFFKGSSLSKGIKGMGDNMNVNVSNAISIDKFKGYGKLSGKNSTDLLAGHRVKLNDDKKSHQFRIFLCCWDYISE